MNRQGMMSPHGALERLTLLPESQVHGRGFVPYKCIKATGLLVSRVLSGVSTANEFRNLPVPGNF